MNHIYAVQTSEELQRYQDFAVRIQQKLEVYLDFLCDHYHVTDLPRAVVWTSAETATKLFSNIPIPAYTNDYRTVFCPDVESWRSIYLKQLDGISNDEIRSYYETKLTENHLLQILGHEFVHHSELFIDGDYANCIWFEEGMCEYISRKYFLTDAEFKEEAEINALLVKQLQERYGNHSIEDFGAETYGGDYASIFFEYWRSFLAVGRVIAQFDGDIPAVFAHYHKWHRSGAAVPLSCWFHLV